MEHIIDSVREIITSLIPSNWDIINIYLFSIYSGSYIYNAIYEIDNQAKGVKWSESTRLMVGKLILEIYSLDFSQGIVWNTGFLKIYKNGEIEIHKEWDQDLHEGNTLPGEKYGF